MKKLMNNLKNLLKNKSDDGKAKAEPTIVITARRYIAAEDRWESVEITNVRMEKLDG